MSIATGVIRVTPWRKTERATTRSGVGHPDEAIGREVAQNRRTWAALERLGVREGAELPLHFFFETAGTDADCELAEFLRDECGYTVMLESDGLAGTTPPMTLGPAAIDDWVRELLYAGYQHGGCAFAGWTATVSLGGTKPAQELCRQLDSAPVAAVNDGIALRFLAWRYTISPTDRDLKFPSPSKETETVSIESDANQDLAMSDEDAEGVVGGKANVKKSGKSHKLHPQHAAAPAEVDTEVQASGGAWQPVVDDPSEDC